MEFGNINSISRSYKHQEDYNRFTEMLIFDNLTQLASGVKIREVLKELGVWNDIILLGKELVEQYEKTLKQINTK